MTDRIKKRLSRIPRRPGVYIFFNARRVPIYIGKASDLNNRVRSYFRKTAVLGPLKSGLVTEIAGIRHIETPSEIEALILEAELIKKHRPRFNVLLKDSTDYFYVGITSEAFPKVFITHRPQKIKSPAAAKAASFAEVATKAESAGKLKLKIKNSYIGPFTDGTVLKKSLRAVRRTFPFCTCRDFHKRYCLNGQIGRCSGVCCLREDFAKKDPDYYEKRRGYRTNIEALKKILTGQKRGLVRILALEMKKASGSEAYEKAAKLRDQIKGLREIFAHEPILNIKRREDRWTKTGYLLQAAFGLKRTGRIEAYDISHISGTNAVGSMVVFHRGKTSPDDYRRFRIRLAYPPAGGDDPAMMREVIGRRLEHREWPLPDLIIVDGGRAQLGAAVGALKDRGLRIPALALAKGKNEIHSARQPEIRSLETLPEPVRFLILRIRDQAHRFAIKYHRSLRRIK